MYVSLILLLVCILCSSISSSIWGYEGNKLDTIGRCGSRSVILCPLNENIGNSKYDSDMFTWLQQGTLSPRHIFNTYYYDDGSGTGLQYCKEDFSVCQWNDGTSKILLSDFLLYRTVFTNTSGHIEAFFILPLNFILDMATKSGSIQTLEEFTNTLNEYDKQFDRKTQCSHTIDSAKQQEFFNDCIFFKYPYDAIVKTLKETVYKNLSPTIISSYARRIENKVNVKESLTAFEYFSYFAIQSKADNKIYKFLSQAII